MNKPKVHVVSVKDDAESFSLSKLLEVLDAVDKQLIDMPQEELDVVKNRIPAKVDGLFQYLKACTDRAVSLRDDAKDMIKAAKSLENKRDQIEDWIASNMAEMGFEKLPGNRYDVIRSTSESTEVDSVEFSPEFIDKYEPYLRVKYEFDKESLKHALRDGIYDLPFARLQRNHHLRFSPKRNK